MKTDQIVVVSFKGPSTSEDREVRNSAAALFYKYASRGRKVSWWRQTGSHDKQNLGFALVSRTGESSATGTVGVYAVSHGGMGVFGGFPENSVTIGAKLLRMLMDTAKLGRIDQLSLVACSTGKGEKGLKYLEDLAAALSGVLPQENPLRIIAWENWVTVFDVRYLVRLVSDPKEMTPRVEEFKLELMQLLIGGAGEGGAKVLDRLDEDFKELMKSPNAAKAMKSAEIGFLTDALASNPAKLTDAARVLYGKKVSRKTNTIDFFTRPTGLLKGHVKDLDLPEALPEKSREALEKAITFKKTHTFTWEIDLDDNKKYLRPSKT